ncbi:kinesin-domain-containing protein [Panus rudis PR-1116 ss-1]|nr:kinesin-domain-containing protein [Panus rudis PR-1116 ss-1]
MAPPPSSSGGTTSVQVALRIRPTTTQDTSSIPARFQRTVIHAISPTSVSVDATAPTPASAGSSTAVSAASSANAKKQVFTFDQVHPPATTQHALFTSTAQPLISRFVEGFNCTILAYGQTSSGKTFTMTGIDLDADPSDPSNGMGIIPRAVSTIFARCREIKEEKGNAWHYSLKGSFIEIYNEDLIDLLSEDGGRRDVQIREDKQGHIIWEGLREVSVKNPNEVMNLIRKGTSIRRTNETDMNAQSSRSHAIFSLTLTQKKFVGSGPPPRSSSPLPPGGRSPSRLARPGSVYSGAGSTRVSSPTFGRPSTPSFAVAMGRGSRPASSLGFLTADGGRGNNAANNDSNDQGGEWVTVVSKFHFVDLAGSERLKRTAAAGERIKEGISINSGLLALGNVISALGDPARAKSHTATYVPYRDSKLTRLLQDSLGGNAHTLMIACVSPAEWNAAETVNTLKYANRARNIKNRAVVNEKEEGWDDVEWLQTTVTRLRKELKQLKESGGISINTSTGAVSSEPLEGAGKKVLQQMAELQNNYEDLRSKFVERTEELTRLRRDLAEKERSAKGGHIGGTAKYEEIVGPVIEEYEKTISAMEAELSLNRAALRHTNEMVEEKEIELSQLAERHSTTEMYVEELRSRVAKLTEREASTEAYIHDLEEKVKLYDESSISSSGSITDLKKELAKYKDTESHSAQYIADLEARLARADESVLALRETVEKLESECERRREEAESLHARLDAFMQDGESWRNDLEERERKVRELELKMQEWEAKRQEANEDRERLGELAVEVARAKKQLEDGSLTPNGTSQAPSETSSINEVDKSIEAQLVALQQTHAATLADLSSVTSKYREALREIADLAAQLQEAKVNAPSSVHSLRSLSQSVSLSQELSSARSRKASISSHGTSSPSSRRSPTHSPSHSRQNLSVSIGVNPNERSVASLEHEIMRLQEVLKEREAEITALETSLRESEDRGRKAERSPSPPTAVNGDSSVTANGHVNGDAEDGEALMHLSPKTRSQFRELRRSMDLSLNKPNAPTDHDASLERLNELMRSMAQKESSHQEIVNGLESELSQVKRQLEELNVLSRDQVCHGETLRCLSLMEQSRKRQEDAIQVEQLKSRETELTEALEKANAEHDTAVQQLKQEHEQALRVKESEVDALISRLKEEHANETQTLRSQLTEASDALKKAHQEHQDAFGKLQAEHEETLRQRNEEIKELLEQTRKEHDEVLAKTKAEAEAALKRSQEESAAVLQKTEDEYYEALTKLRSDHAAALEKQASDAATVLERLKDEHAGALRMAEIAREGSLTESQSERDTALKGLQEEHAAAIAKKESQFAEDLQALKEEHAQLLKTKEEQHRASVLRLKTDHANVLAEKEAAIEERVEALQKEHERAMKAKEAEFAQALEKASHDSQQEIKKLQDELTKQVEQLTNDLNATRDALEKANESHSTQLEDAVREAKEQQASVLQEIERAHEEDMAKVKEAHEAALAAAQSKAEEERSSIIQSHTEELLKLRAEHQNAMAEVQANLIAAQEQHRNDLAESRSQTERLLTDEKERLKKSLAELEAKHAEERATLLKDHDLLMDELASYKAASDEFATVREEMRVQHENALAQKSDVIAGLQGELTEVRNEKTNLQTELANLRAELEYTRSRTTELVREASKRESLVEELEKHRSVIAEMQENLQKTKDEMDTLQAEKQRQESILKDLQAQLTTRSPSPGSRPMTNRPNGIPPAKLPPLSPPPSVPPPPTPRGTHEAHPSAASTIMSASSSRSIDSLDSPSTPATSVHQPLNGLSSPTNVASAINATSDLKLMAQVQNQAKQLEEQEVMIKTLNKQLTHCESDLQAHMDMVNTLETSLAESEKNLRKARMQATELARERDNLTTQITALRTELSEAKKEVVTVRRSIVEEKQSLEHRLDEERRAKERARAQLDSRMDELQRRKSKFACL